MGHSIGNGNHPGGGDKGRSSSEETAKQAVVLFTIVAIFVFCNFIRIAMNVYDLVYIKVRLTTSSSKRSELKMERSYQ